jgi:hypothetical protein
MKTKFVFAGILGMAFLAIAAPHTWTFQKGGTFEGDYFSSGTEKVVIRKDGTNNIFKIADLSTNDEAYIAKIKADQKQARLDAEAKQMASDGMIELTRNLIQNYPEKLDRKSGWMDAEFLEVGGDSKYNDALVTDMLGFEVRDKEQNIYSRCVVTKGLSTQIDKTVLQLQRGEKLRLIGHVVIPQGELAGGWFMVSRIEMIESAAEKKAKEQQDTTAP